MSNTRALPPAMAGAMMSHIVRWKEDENDDDGCSNGKFDTTGDEIGSPVVNKIKNSFVSAD